MSNVTPNLEDDYNSVSIVVSQDFDGTPREQDATGKGYPVVDMGAYEYAGAQQTGSTTIVLTPSAYEVSGGTLTLTAQLVSPNGTPTGTVSFFENQTQIGGSTIDASGATTIDVPSLTPGVYAFVATYPGSQPSASPVFTPAVSVKIYVLVDSTTTSGNPTTTSLRSSANPAKFGTAVVFTATVSSANGIPAGSVAFAAGNTTLRTQTLTNGSATCSTDSLPVGSQTITANYQPGSSGFAASSASLAQVVNGLPSSTTLAIKPNSPYALQPAQLTAVVKGQTGGPTPTGTVTFSDTTGALATATLDATGTAVVLYQFPNSGPDTVTASYSGDATYSTSTSAPVAITVTINDSAAVASASPNPASALQPVTLNAALASDTAFFFSVSPFGTVTFYDGATSIGTATLAGGYASLAASFAAGQHAITVAYPGNSAFKPSTSQPYALTVNPDATSTTVTESPNPAVVGSSITFTATVTAASAPSGSVTFFDGATAIGSASLSANGTATFSTSLLALGTHSITAAYAATSNFAASISAPLSEVIVAFGGDFSLNVAPSSRSLYTGEAAQFTATLAPSGGWNQDVALSCGPLPANATCAFAPATVAGSNGVSALLIQTSAPQRVVARQTRLRLWPERTGAALVALALGVFPVRRRRVQRTWGRALWRLALIAAVVGINGCGAGSVAGGTPPGTYTVPITATFSKNGQTVVHTAKVILSVKSLF